MKYTCQHVFGSRLMDWWVSAACHPALALGNEAVARSEDHVAAEDSCQRERVDYGEHVICGVAQAKVNA